MRNIYLTLTYKRIYNIDTTKTTILMKLNELYRLLTDFRQDPVISIVSFCGMQIFISIFSIFAVSLIQQRTPNHLIGKVMAYTSTITLCIQPIGQIIYGFLFDGLSNMIYFVLIPTGIIVCVIGILATGFFRNMEKNLSEKAI